ncbi:hypothetical protein TTHNP4_00348 (plasmid) [Thermus thermophilus]|uniref:Winged helix-turn helix domain-containing protein n=4 Tax=Thermus TaxID=270 RepID=A0A3P4AWG5_THETH|nr:winged helix-turn-helix domain-containing protein [Thermus thermophilus]VCU54939.1 hypothetical protein TTHNP4_00348 [Thermus thermophilus]
MDGGRPGRPPGLLGLAVLKELPRLDADLLRRLGFSRSRVLHQGLKLLRLALGAHLLGADLRWDTGEKLKKSLLEFLQGPGNARRLLATLGKEEREFLGLKGRGSPKGEMVRLVKSLHLNYHPRDLLRRLLKELAPFFASLSPPAGIPWGSTPETWAAATPLVGAFRGVFFLLERSYGLDSADFERAMAASWVFYPFLLYSSSMTVADHLTLNELWRRVKKAKDPIEKHRFLAVYHAKRGLTAKEIAKITLSSIRWVQETVRRYNREGPEGLRDKRHQNPGQKPKLTPEEQRRVLEALQGPPPDGGLWTGPKLRDWVERELGKKLSLYPIYRLLHEMGFALRVPRPRHAKADGEAQEAFKKTSPPRSRRRGPRGGR